MTEFAKDKGPNDGNQCPDTAARKIRYEFPITLGRPGNG